MANYSIESVLKDWLTPKDMERLDQVVKYLEELGEKAKNIKTLDDAYDFATKDLGMKCTKEEFDQGAKTLEYIGDQIKKEAAAAEKQAESAYLDAVAAYMTAEKRLKSVEEEYAKYNKELKAEFDENRKLAPAYVEEAAKKMEEDTKKFYGDVQKALNSKEAKQYMEYFGKLQELGKRISKVKTTKDAYEVATDLGLDCSWDDFKATAKSLGMYYKD